MSTNYETLYGSNDDDDLTAHGALQDDQYVYYATIHGGDGNDTVTAINDFGSDHYGLYGDGGNDVIVDLAYDAKVLLAGGDGDDTIFAMGQGQEVDGGDGYDKLDSSSFTLDTAKVKNIEELVIDGWTEVGDFDLHSFQKISVAPDAGGAELHLSHADDLDNITIETNGEELLLDGSSENDHFDLRSYDSRFVVFGSNGDDTILGGSGGMRADGGNGDDYVQGGEGNDELSGGDSQNRNAHDTVLGLGGDDQIDFRRGGGVLDGGGGEDTLYVNTWQKALVSFADLTLANIEVIDFFEASRVDLSTADLSGIEKLTGKAKLLMSRDSVFDDVAILSDARITIRGTDFDDVSSFAGSEGTLYFHGGDGQDDLRADGGTNWLWGDNGDDTLSGGLGVNHLNGGDGADVLAGGGKNDELASGKGADRISGGGGDDTIKLLIGGTGDTKNVDAGAGNDEIFALHSVAVSGHGDIKGGAGDDSLYASGDLSGHRTHGVEALHSKGELIATAGTFNSFDNIYAESVQPFSDPTFRLVLSSGGTFTWHNGSVVQDALLTGSGQRDMLDFSAAGNAWIIMAGDGRDVVTGTSFGDGLSGQGGDDTLVSGAGNDNDFGGLGNDTIFGGDGDDFIQGDDGSDHIDGGKGRNDIDGGNGDDILLGYGTRDEIDGGEGNDTIQADGRKVFVTGGAGNDILVAGAGLAYINGDEGRDKFVLSDETGGAIVYDFDKSSGEKDVIDFSSVSTIRDYQDLLSHHVKMIDHDAALLITYGSSEVALVGVTTSQLHQDDFIF